MIDPIALIVLNGATIDTQFEGRVENIHSLAVSEYHELHNSDKTLVCQTGDGEVFVDKKDVDEILKINQ